MIVVARPITATALVATGLLVVSVAQAAELDGYLQEAIAVRTGEGDILYHRQTMNLRFQEDVSRKVMLRFEVDFWRDDPDFQDDRVRTRLREGYVRLRQGDFDVRLGRVQIAWGEADGVIVSDQVSPFDIENFITPGFDEIRKGVDGIFVDYYRGTDYHVELLWISHFEPPDFPSQESPWFPIDVDRFEQGPVNVEVARFTRPANTFENSEFGARVSGHPPAADWSIGYLRSWDDRPNLRIRQGEDPLSFVAVPQHNRFDLLTANLVYPIAGYLVKVDAAYERGRFLQLDPTEFDPLDPDTAEIAAAGFVAKHDVLRVLAGFDAKPSVPGWHQADASFQYVHEEVIDPHSGLAVADSSDLLSVLLRAAYRNDTIKPWLFAIVDPRGANTWIQAKIDYQPIDNWRFSLEYDWFGGHDFDGDNGGIFGLFDDNDLVQATVRYSY